MREIRTSGSVEGRKRAISSVYPTGRRSDVGGRKSEIGDQRSEVGSRRSEVGDRRSEVRSQESGDSCQRAGIPIQRTPSGCNTARVANGATQETPGAQKSYLRLPKRTP